jgi:hypothetical protein
VGANWGIGKGGIHCPAVVCTSSPSTVADDRLTVDTLKAKNALRLILCFEGYESRVTAEAAAKFPLLDCGSGEGCPWGASWSNSLPASAVTPYARFCPPPGERKARGREQR